MDYCNIYFNKGLDKIEYKDIVNFFKEEKEESNKIEFKSFSSQNSKINKGLEGVIKPICAMLNSEGGIVIWGAPEGYISEGRKEKVFKGVISPVNEFKEKDWLINKISDSITPLPVNINVKILTDNNNYIYVFEIQKSNYKPHQYRNIYYVRLDGQTKPAPHYFIESMFKQIKYPNIGGYVKLENIHKIEGKYKLKISILFYNFSFFQNEERFSYNLSIDKGQFERNEHYNSGEVNYSDNKKSIWQNDFFDFLHHGEFYAHVENLVFDKLDYDEINLVLSWSGKYSPKKQSEYNINLRLIDIDTKGSLNYIFTFISENKTIAEIHRQKGLSDHDILKECLER